MNSDRALSCREMFRQHAMDLPLPAECAPRQPHWMLQDDALKGWIADVQMDYWRLSVAGGDPLDGDPIESEAVIRRLGFADRQAPRGFFECLGFTASMVLSATRESFRVHSEIRRLRRRACIAARVRP